MQYQKVLKMLESIPYLSVGIDVGAVMHKICNIIFAMLRDNKPFEIITPEEHCKRYAAEHPESVNTAS